MKKFLLLSYLLLSATFVQAQTVNYLHDPSSVCIDGNSQNLGAVTFDETDFPNGCEITDVNVTIWWAKTDGTCASPTGGGCSFHNETYFSLNGPSSTEVLAMAGSWSGCASSPNSVTTIFNTGSPAIPGGTPVSGTYSPNGGGSLADYNGESALGTWSLLAGDNAGIDPLLVGAYQLDITTATDNTNPVMTVPSTITVSNDPGQCGATVSYSVSSTDVCGSTHVLTSPASTASGQFFPIGTTTVTWEATDTYNNQHSNSFNIIVNDTEPPAISCPSNITTTVAAGTCAQNVTYSLPTHSDNCGSSSLALTAGPAPGGSFPAGTTTVSYTATDPASNSSSCSFTVTVNDNIPPAISCPANFSVNASAGQCDATVTYSTPTATDNCPGVSVAISSGPASGSTVGVGSSTVVYTATDAASNTASCSFVVTVVDNQNPSISCPGDITVGNATGACGNTVSWTAPVGTDNCPGAVTVQTAGPASGSPFSAETTTTISYQVTDGAGLTASCSFNVTVNDDELPVITCPADVTTSVDAGQCSAVVAFADATFTDNCPGGSVSQTGGLTSNSQFGVNSSPNTVTFTATDAAGNSASCSFDITVNDDEDPTIACPADIVVDNDPGQCDAVVSWVEPVGSDNCPGQSTVRTGPGPGSTFNVLSTTTITYTVTDASSNTADCSFTVTVEDNDFPIVTCPADQNITFVNCEYTLPDYLALGLVTRTDNCSPLVEVQSPSAGTVITEETTVQVSVTDPSLNETVCSFTITPLDNTPPTFDACPTDADSVSVNNSCQFFMPDYSTMAVSDVCNPTLTITQVPLAGIPLTTTTSVTVTVSDGTNETDCVFDVAPKDDTAPSIVCPADDLVSVDVNCEATLADYTGDATVDDNCDTNVDVTQSPTGTITGTTTVTLTATDDAGNTASCTFEVEVEDNTAPSITCPASETVYYNASCLYSMEDHTGLATGVSDNCSSVTLTQVPVVGTSIGSNATVELIATDAAGNVNSCTFNLMIEDTVSPTLACPVDQTLSVDAGCEASLADYTGLASATDNCPTNTVTVTQSPSAGTTYNLTTDPTVAVTITATDGTNSSTCTFNVLLQDNIDPVLTCPSPVPVTANADCEFVLTNFINGDPVGTDNCDVALSYTQVPAPSTLVQGNTLVTITGEDDAGNTGSCSFTLVVEDNTNPTISCPPTQTVDASAICDFTLDAYEFMAITDDNCDDNVVVTQSPAAGTVHTADVLVTLTGTDDAGNTSDCSFFVRMGDVSAPSITCPSDDVVDFGAACTFVLDDYVGDETTSDNCDLTIDVTQSPAAGTSHSGNTVVTLTAADDAGNQSTCTFSVIPEDNTDPTITCPGDQIVSSSLSGGNCVFFIPDLTGSATVSDNCDSSPTVTQSPGIGNVITANTTITLTAEDDNNNTADCTFDLILNDDADPSITCPGDLTVEVDANCQYEILDYTGLAVATDNCSTDPTVTQGASPSIGSTIGPGVPTTITLTATDDSSNTDVCTFIITAEDVTGPTLTCPGPTVTVSSNANCLVFLDDYTGSGTVADNCDGNSPTILQSPVAGTAIGGTTQVTLYATDINGNLGECVFNVELDDQTPPTIVCPSDQVVPSDATCGYVLADYTGFATTSDNCDLTVDVTQSPAAPANVSGVTVVTLTATDDNSNSASCTFNVSAEDVIVPTITNCPENDTVTVAANCTHIIGDYTGIPSYSDNCDPTPSISVVQAPLAGSLIGGNTTVTITATDLAGNAETCTFLVVPEDNDPPTVFDCPSDIVQENDPSLCGAVVTYGPITAIDNCAGVIVPQLTQGQVSGSIFNVGVTAVEYVADDSNGNTTLCQFSVTINDTEDPVVLCPADIAVNVDPGICGADVTYSDPTVTDNCPSPSTPTLDAGLASGSTFPVGVTTNTFSSTDASGNTASCSFTVTVSDNESPTITCPSDVTVSNDPGSCDAVVTYGLPTVGDNCPGLVGPTLVSGGASGDVFPVGSNTVNYSVVDASGNTNNCSFNVTVNDDEDPVLTCPADTAINCDANVVYDVPTVADNCVNGIIPVQVSPTIGDPLAFGPNLITFEGDDGNGNVGTCSFTVTIIDTVATTITCPADLTESFDANCELPAPDYTGLGTATDNCDLAPVITQVPSAGSTITGTATITLIATDFANNSSECTFNVIDDTPPTVDCPADVLVGSDINCEFTLIDYTSASTSSDNCGGTVLSQDPVAGTVIGGLTTVTITSTDDFGNIASCQFTVDLFDNIDPSISCIGNQTVLFDANCTHELSDYTNSIISSDNCDANVDVTQDPVAGTVVSGATTVTMTGTDDSGNSVSCTFDVSPIDIIPPTIDCPSDQIAQFDTNCEFALDDYSGMALIDDNCSAVDVLQTPAAGAVLTANTVVTLTASDADQNTASCSFVVMPEDNVDPSILCPGDLEVDFDVNCDYTLTDYTSMATTDDNCSTVLTVTQSPALGTIVNGSTEVTLTVNDGNGNTAECSFNVVPEDNMPPSIICPDDLEVAFDENCEFEIGDYNASATTSDNCSSVITVSQLPASGTTVVGPTEVVLTADDGNGNTADCSFMVIPEDETDPTISCPTSLDVQFASNTCSYSMSDLTSLVTTDDNCSAVTVTQDPAIGTIITDTLAVVFTATDLSGNSATCSFIVNPSDETEPIAICPPDLEVDFDENCEFVIPDYKPDVDASDNCGFTLISQSPDEGAVVSGDTEILITVDDGNGNSTTCTFNISPSDNLPPELVCPTNQLEDLDENCQFELPDYTGLATAEDNCTANLTLDQFPPQGTVILESTVVTLSVEDENGNGIECSFAVIPEDNTLPEIAECPENQFASLDENCELAMPDFTGLIQATDNCELFLDYQQLPLPGSAVAGVGTYAITLGAGDANNNYAVCEFDLIVTDDTDPMVVCPADQVIELNENCQFEVPDYTAMASGTDACGSVTLTQSPLAGAIITGQLNATIIAEDEHGNTATCTFFVDVVEMSATVAGTNVTCQGGSDGTATVTVIGGTAPYTEDWGGFNPNALEEGTYAVTVSDANGCTTTASVTIEDGPLFEIEIDPSGEVVICDGDLVTLDAGSGYASYNWSTGATVQSITVSNEASYWVTVISAEGCESNTDTVTVSFFDDPQPTVISTSDGIISCSNDTASSYQWYLNGAPIAGATNSYYCPTESGNYHVVITDSNGCIVSSIIEEYTYDDNSPCATGIDEHGLTLDVYPNPSDGLFTVTYALEFQTDMVFAVYDLLGQRVTEDELISAQSGTQVIDLSGIADGIYTLRIALGNEKVVQQRLVLVK